MPALCSLLLPSYYSNNFAGKIDASLGMGIVPSKVSQLTVSGIRGKTN